VVDWKSLGIRLDISDAKLEEIRIYNRDHVEGCKIAMVTYWLQSDKTCSWKKIIDALTTISLHVMAEGIRTQYCPLYQG